MRAIAYSLNRIAERFPELSEEQLLFMQECLEDCFEIGRTWDSIPILVQEAKPPAVESHPSSEAPVQSALTDSSCKRQPPGDKPKKPRRKPARKSARNARRRKKSARR